VTGSIIQELFEKMAKPGQRLGAYVSSTGSAGTIAAGDYLRTKHPDMIVTAVEALQCPTLYSCGFGGHRIEGIGDKHVPWVHNVRNTDMVSAVDDQQCMDLLRLFNEEEGKAVLAEGGVSQDVINQLDLLGISSICNLVSAIQTAKYYDMDERDIIFMPLTDAAEMYSSRLTEQNTEQGAYKREKALMDQNRWLQGCTPDYVRELTYHDRKTLHNFKYFTWVEQQGRSVEDLRKLWDRDFWTETFSVTEHWDKRINEFNERVGL